MGPGSAAPEPARFCWYCAQPVADRRRVAVHYETGRYVYFCCDEHWTSYYELWCL